MRKIIWSIAIAALVLPFIAPSYAQENPTDALVIGADSGLWLSNTQGASNPPIDLAENENFDPYFPLQVSPTGRYVFFQSIPPAYPGASGSIPTDLYLFDLTSNSTITVLQQTLNAEAGVLGDDVSDIVAWSPDGTKVAFVTLGNQPTGSLHVYDVASQTDSVISTSIPISFGVPFAPDLVWTSTGLAILVSEQRGDGFAEVLVMVDPSSGAEVTRVDFSQTAAVDVPVEYFVAQRDGAEVLVISTLSEVVLFNFGTMTLEPFEGVLQMVVPAGGLKLNYLPLGAQGGLWEAETADGGRFALAYTGLWRTRSIAINPTGDTAAYIMDGVKLWQGGQEVGAVAVPSDGALDVFNSSLVWGVGNWQIIAGGYG